MSQVRSKARRAWEILSREGPDALFRAVHRKVAVSVESKLSNPPESHLDVLFISGCDASSPYPARYRVDCQAEQLEGVGVTCDCEFYLDVVPNDENRADVFVLSQCPMTDSVRKLVFRALEGGKRIYFDTNDPSLVRQLGDAEKSISDDGALRVEETLRLCDAAIVSTERLKTVLEQYVPHAFVNRSIASQEMVLLSESALASRSVRATGRLILGYFGDSFAHDEDFALIAGALGRVFLQRPSTHLVVSGVSTIPDELNQYSDRITFRERVTRQELPGLIAGVDINLVPLENSLPNEAKSEDGWIDAALVGVPTIASNVGTLKTMIRQNDTGVLCSTEREWEEAILVLVDDSNRRERIAEAARSFCLCHCTTSGTGFPFAKELVGRGCSIDRVLPDDGGARAKLVESYLASRGISVPAGKVPVAPWESMSLESRIDDLLRAHDTGKKSVALLYEMTSGDTPTFRYFGYNLCQRLRESERWHAEYYFTSEIDSLDEVLDVVDAAILVRMRIRPDIVTVVERLHARGVPVAYLVDDDVVGLVTAPRVLEAMSVAPDDEFATAFWFGATDRFERAADLTDCFVAPVDTLAQSLSERFDRPSYVIHSSLNDEQIAASREALVATEGYRRSKHPFTLGYFSGTNSHGADFVLCARPLVAFLAAHKDAHLLLVGHLDIPDEIDYFLQEGRVIVLPPVDYSTLQYLQASVDVILAPLVVDSFTNCKSALKVFEAGIVGVPSCASPSFAYREAIDDSESGFLCSTEDEWRSSFEKLYLDSSLCRAMGERALRKARRTYYGAVIAREAETCLDAMEKVEAGATRVPSDEMLRYLSLQGLNWDDPFAINPPYGKRALERFQHSETGDAGLRRTCGKTI